jgi:diaminobutyrate-2-oxoglutarate transaminase
MEVFEQLESEVQSYGRQFRAVWVRARGSYLYDEQGNSYLDFLCGAGSLNYGHNNPLLKEALIEYLNADGIVHGLDMYTAARRSFLETLNALVLQPRGFQYVVQFPGPTGTNAVEAALKIARKVTGRHNVIAFTNAFHGVTLGSLAATGNAHHRGAAGVPLQGITSVPYDGYLGSRFDSTAYLDKVLSDNGSGMDPPAAVLVETVQGEGGLNVARPAWLCNLSEVCRKHGALLIVDDIQTGCGRTGAFFSFEEAGIVPDIVTLSKSLSGYGLPLSVVLLRKELDCWRPGEHNGTFRGSVPALVTSTAALRNYWADAGFSNEVRRKAGYLRERLSVIATLYGEGRLVVRGRGMMVGLHCGNGQLAGAIARAAFERSMLLECTGSADEVVKCMPALTASDEELAEGMNALEACVAECMAAGDLRLAG